MGLCCCNPGLIVTPLLPRCYQCGLEQMCWEPFESPWIRHGFLAPDCSYVERIKVGR